MEKILLIGGGGHCKVVIDAIVSGGKYKIAGIIDLKNKIGEEVLGVQIRGIDADIEEYFKKGIKNCFITVGSLGNPGLRIKISNSAKRVGFNFPNIIHPGSCVSRFTKFGEGNYIAVQAIINAGSRIGNNCIINTGAIIDHDCTIGDFVHVAPGVTISGGVIIGKNSHIGVGSLIVQSVKIGVNSIIGAGSVVLADVGNNIVAYGNPCRKIKINA